MERALIQSYRVAVRALGKEDRGVGVEENTGGGGGGKVPGASCGVKRS